MWGNAMCKSLNFEANLFIRALKRRCFICHSTTWFYEEIILFESHFYAIRLAIVIFVTNQIAKNRLSINIRLKIVIIRSGYGLFLFIFVLFYN